MKQKTLILGIGSPFADDQFGWFVADKLAEIVREKNIQNITVESADRPGLNLLTFLDSGYDKIILIDAVYAKVTPGTEFYFKAKDILSFGGFLSSHSVGVAPSLALADAIGMDISNVEFYGVEGQRIFEKDEILSDIVKGAIESMSKKIVNNLDL
ncbi:hydrogenase maturation protease [Francisella philomiragia]|uniref:Hydrogenase maturation protease family protein n=1 Tax=Francisella philomiragia subsp. philomiragia (strain ATCC 25017 / CCUG 19701 / FSC 153 / O\|nr:hydrogenase maturation protease [Francisella philomiragia]AJI46918.1 hydrogenase maturation protease family protein [Francisella philomiragia]AJI50107.1 hydrogenase maturation protease family protein [Francisella philomiragia]MBK2021120.1 hydrogenase maturation protease [Francisella philomiragia]MBK2030953.1 hydrogenase maturation protease [Francisella philomiragia]MBK2264461.1 hydrogenase maturation protease [Francisella philomiragia]